MSKPWALQTLQDCPYSIFNSELSRVFATCLTSTRRGATGAGQRRVVQVATVCAAAACMAALVVAGAGETRRAVRMTDDSMQILMTPHFVPALEQATATGRSQMLSQQQAAQ